MNTRSKRSSISSVDRHVLEVRCRSPVIIQRDLKRARIVLLAAEGRSMQANAVARVDEALRAALQKRAPLGSKAVANHHFETVRGQE